MFASMALYLTLSAGLFAVPGALTMAYRSLRS